LKQVILNHWRPALETLVEAQPARSYRWITIAWLAALYIIGIVGFGIFFEWGNFDLEYHDWADITGPRLQFVRSAILAGQFPLHISDPSTMHGFTLRYLAVPDAFFSPQYLILWKLPVPLFSLINVWFLYTLGFLGLLLLRGKLRLSPFSFALLFLLFNFNGHILAHYSVGHTTWGGYFLFPFLAWLVFRLLDGDHSWRWTAMTAALLFAIWLQGSFHQFIWALMLLALIGICVPRTFLVVIKTGLISLLASAFRLLPSILLYGKYSAGFENGYPSLYSIWVNLVSVPDPVKTPFFVPGLGGGLGEWELTAFIGLLGGLFLIFFGLYRGLLHPKAPYRGLLAPLGAIMLISLGPVYQLVLALPVPLIQGERVSSRMFSLVLVFGLILGAERLQRWIEGVSIKPFILAAGWMVLAFSGVELWQDFNIWRIANRQKDFWIVFDRHKWFVNNNYTDTTYLWLIWGGLALSAVTFLVLGWLSWREFRLQRKQSDHKTAVPQE
jgi:hypothetical protein